MVNVISFGSGIEYSEQVFVSASQRLDILVSNRAYEAFPDKYFVVVVQAKDSGGHWTYVGRITEKTPSMIWIGKATLRFIRQSGHCSVDVEVI